MAANTKHGLAGSPEYRVWSMVKNRCLNKRGCSYIGDRGVSLFKPWARFERFYADVGPKPGPGYRLERFPDRSGNFEPGNVRWKSSSVTQVPSLIDRGSKAMDLVGKTFGKLIVLRIQRVRLGNGKLHAKAICKCACGNEIAIFWTSLDTRVSKSCGCDLTYDKTTGENNYKFNGFKEMRAGFWSRYIANAMSRGIEFDITKEYAWKVFEVQDRRCALSGVKLIFVGGKRRADTTASIDRIDPLSGYVEGNIQWVHKTLNTMKMDLPMGEFIGWCHRVALQHPSIENSLA